MIDTVTAYAPNFKASVLGRQIFSPLDLERTFGLIGGDIFHGALQLDQMFSRAAHAGARQLSRPDAWPVYVWFRNASWRWGHRRARTQRGSRDHRGLAARSPPSPWLIGENFRRKFLGV